MLDKFCKMFWRMLKKIENIWKIYVFNQLENNSIDFKNIKKCFKTQ